MTLIADEQGLGKTCSATAFCNFWKLSKVLIICPKSLMINWEREWASWTVHTDLVVEKVVSGKPYPKNADVVIINYDICSTFTQEIKKHTWDVVILDEAHYIQNRQTARARFVLGGTRASGHGPLAYKKMLLLTGTPCDRPINLWVFCRLADPEGLGRNYHSFGKRYCNAHETKWSKFDVSGASNLDELNILLKRFMIRHVKEQVCEQLPAKQKILLPVTSGKLTEETLIHREIQQFKRVNPEEYLDPDDTNFKDMISRLDKNTVADVIQSLADLAKTRQAIAELKLPSVYEFADGILEQGRKVIIFGYHRAIVKALAEHYGEKCVHIIGGMETEERQSAVDRFQNDPNITVFVGQITAAGVGITLTAACDVVFAEIDYRRSAIEQAIDRAHRIGQVNFVNAYFIVLDRSLDARIIETYMKKDSVVRKIITPTES